AGRWLVGASIVVLAGVLCAGSLGRTTAGGDLAFLDCIGATASPTSGCSASANVTDAFAAAVSPDNGDVYVASPGSRAMGVLARGADGKLTPSGCLGASHTGPGNCTGVDDLAAVAVAVSPDGR